MLNLIHFINISHYFFLTTEQEGSGTDDNDVINNNNGGTTDDEDGFEGSAENEVSFSIYFDYYLKGWFFIALKFQFSITLRLFSKKVPLVENKLSQCV